MKPSHVKIAAIAAVAVATAAAAVAEETAGKNEPHPLVYTEAPALVGVFFLLAALGGVSVQTDGQGSRRGLIQTGSDAGLLSCSLLARSIAYRHGRGGCEVCRWAGVSGSRDVGKQIRATTPTLHKPHSNNG